MPLRIIRAVFKQAWRETSQSHLAGLVRSERSDQWWERIKHEPGRHREGLKQSRQGKWPGFEEPFVIAFGSDWRSLRDACASLAEWRQYERKFVHVLSTAWCLDWLWCEYDTLFPESVNTGSEPAVTQPKHMRFSFESLRLPPVHDQDTLRDLAQAKRQIECVVDNEQVCKATVGLSSISDTTMHGFLQHILFNLFTIFGKNVPRGYVSDPIQWRPREWNCAADLLANVGLQSPHELVHMDMSRIGSASFLQCHSDGGFIPADGTGSWGFTVCIWQHTEQLGWTRDLVGYGHGRFEGCKHSLHAELVALDRLLQTLRPLVV